MRVHVGKRVPLTSHPGLGAVVVVVQAEDGEGGGGGDAGRGPQWGGTQGGGTQALAQVGGGRVVGVHAVLGGHVVAHQTALTAGHGLQGTTEEKSLKLNDLSESSPDQCGGVAANLRWGSNQAQPHVKPRDDDVYQLYQENKQLVGLIVWRNHI